MGRPRNDPQSLIAFHKAHPEEKLYFGKALRIHADFRGYGPLYLSQQFRVSPFTIHRIFLGKLIPNERLLNKALAYFKLLPTNSDDVSEEDKMKALTSFFSSANQYDVMRNSFADHLKCALITNRLTTMAIAALMMKKGWHADNDITTNEYHLLSILNKNNKKGKLALPDVFFMESVFRALNIPGKNTEERWTAFIDSYPCYLNDIPLNGTYHSQFNGESNAAQIKTPNSPEEYAAAVCNEIQNYLRKLSRTSTGLDKELYEDIQVGSSADKKEKGKQALCFSLKSHQKNMPPIREPAFYRSFREFVAKINRITGSELFYGSRHNEMSIEPDKSDFPGHAPYVHKGEKPFIEYKLIGIDSSEALKDIKNIIAGRENRWIR